MSRFNSIQPPLSGAMDGPVTQQLSAVSATSVVDCSSSSTLFSGTYERDGRMPGQHLARADQPDPDSVFAEDRSKHRATHTFLPLLSTVCPHTDCHCLSWAPPSSALQPFAHETLSLPPVSCSSPNAHRHIVHASCYAAHSQAGTQSHQLDDTAAQPVLTPPGMLSTNSLSSTAAVPTVEHRASDKPKRRNPQPIASKRLVSCCRQCEKGNNARLNRYWEGSGHIVIASTTAGGHDLHTAIGICVWDAASGNQVEAELRCETGPIR